MCLAARTDCCAEPGDAPLPQHLPRPRFGRGGEFGVQPARLPDVEVDEKLIPGIPELSPFAPEVMRWRLLDLFRSAEFQNGAEFEDVRNVLQDYLGSGESADYQLAGQLADIFDQYLVYRPQWIDAWQQGRILGLGDDEIWQSKLWRYLDDGRQSAPHRVALWENCLPRWTRISCPSVISCSAFPR